MEEKKIFLSRQCYHPLSIVREAQLSAQLQVVFQGLNTFHPWVQLFCFLPQTLSASQKADFEMLQENCFRTFSWKLFIFCLFPRLTKVFSKVYVFFLHGITHLKLISGYLSSVVPPNYSCIRILSLWWLTRTDSGMLIDESLLHMTFCCAWLPEPLLFFSKHTEVKLRLL